MKEPWTLDQITLCVCYFIVQRIVEICSEGRNMTELGMTSFGGLDLEAFIG